MRGGKELLSSSALDSPSVLRKLATPPPVINSDMSQVIDDSTSFMNDAIDDASALLDDTLPLGEFLDEQLARTKEFENVDTDEILKTQNYETPIRSSYPRYELPKIPEGYVMDGEVARDFLLVRLEKILRNYYAS